MLTADPVRRPNMLRLSVLESSRMPYIFFASRYPISKPGNEAQANSHTPHAEKPENQTEVAQLGRGFKSAMDRIRRIATLKAGRRPGGVNSVTFGLEAEERGVPVSRKGREGRGDPGTDAGEALPPVLGHPLAVDEPLLQAAEGDVDGQVADLRRVVHRGGRAAGGSPPEPIRGGGGESDR